MLKFITEKIKKIVFSKDSEREEFIRKCLVYLKANKIQGNYAEFGVHRGSNFVKVIEMAKRKGMDMNFYGFDSFEGLPETRAFLPKGN